ncbi:DUF998 domain-containing protein [Streptosporangium sp. NPDC050280]|uniref:DUF998 domain-containing protein n=1 Tax=unclassified Streptosporangium TaxID=2632669 RepID=UPI00344489FA
MDSSHLTRKLVVATHAGLVGSLVGATALHIGWAKQVDTVRHTVSDYALSKNTAAVFAGTVASLSVGSAALLAGLVRSRLPIGAPATALLGVWCGGMTLTGIFRTDPQGGVPTARGLTHRYAAGGAIATLPAVGLLIARRLQGMPGWERKARPLRRVSWASAVGGLAFLVTHVSATRSSSSACHYVRAGPPDPVSPHRVRARCTGAAEATLKESLGLDPSAELRELYWASRDPAPAR